MTIADVKNRLFTYFMTDTTFAVDEDIPSLGITDEELGQSLIPHRVALVVQALEDVAKQGIIVQIAPAVYVLTQPLDAFIQPVTLTPIVADMAADLVNVWVNMTNADHVANKMALQSTDIEAICSLCHFLLDEGRGSSAQQKQG